MCRVTVGTTVALVTWLVHLLTNHWCRALASPSNITMACNEQPSYYFLNMCLNKWSPTKHLSTGNRGHRNHSQPVPLIVPPPRPFWHWIITLCVSKPSIMFCLLESSNDSFHVPLFLLLLFTPWNKFELLKEIHIVRFYFRPEGTISLWFN